MTEHELDRVDRAIVNAFQGGFPVVERPFEPAAQALRKHDVEIDPAQLCERIRALEESGVLSRFGAIINANAIGGATTLVAMSAPEAEFDAIADTVNSYPAVAHNYERDHELNMWFVLSVVDEARLQPVLGSIERETGLDTYNLPKLTEFDLGARFPVDGPLSETDIDLSGLGPTATARDEQRLGARERDLLLEIQDGFPYTRTPYRTIADELDVSTEWTLRTSTQFLEAGIFRRIGVVPNHYALGYTENPMTVWNVPDSHVEAVGRAVGSLPFVTHCYERPRHDELWPYNLFAMAHGRSTAQADERVEQIRDAIETHCTRVDSETLNSTRILKKTGLRLAERATNSTKTQ